MADRTHPDVQNAGAEISRHLEQIAKLFKSGVKLTFLARNGDDGTRDMVLTDDSLDAAIRALTIRKEEVSRG